MIDFIKSAELNDITIEEVKDKIKLYPCSNMKIVAICDACGKVRTPTIQCYCDLCVKCANGTDEIREIRREACTGDKNPMFGKLVSSGTRDKLRLVNTGKKRKGQALKNLQVSGKDPVRIEKIVISLTKYYIDHPDELEMRSEKTKQTRIDNPEINERHSALMQGQDYDAGEWTGFAYELNDRYTYAAPESKCIKLNDRFIGSHGHHVIFNVIIYIPAELHRSVYHNLRSGRNMGIINALAFQYLNSLQSRGEDVDEELSD